MSAVEGRAAAERRWFGDLPLAARVAIGVVVALVAVNVVARALDSPVGGSEPGGRTGSVYATAPEGLAAYADLLHRHGHPVERRRGALDDEPLDPRATLLVVEPDAVLPGERSALERFVRSGGRLVIGGHLPGHYLLGLGSDPPRWDFDAPLTWTSVDRSLEPIAEVEASGTGAWVDLGASRTLVGSGVEGVALLTVADVGEGQILYLADVAPLENLGLVEADNAAMALALAGGDARPVVFAEGVHGYSASIGWRAIPGAWKLALGGLIAAALVLMWARGHRLGPPERASRPLPPPRREHVVALAASLARTRSFAETAAPVQEAVRRRLAARGGLGSDAPEEALLRVAGEAGMNEGERRAALGSAESAEDLLAVGRALARLSVDDGGEQ